MKIHIVVVCWVFALILANICEAEVPVFENPLEPPVSRTVTMEEVWRIGDNEDEEFIFGVIGQVLSDDQGCFYLLDTQQYEMHKFSPDGQFLKTVSRNGEGPGEINLCYTCKFWDLQTIACNNNFPQALVLFDLDGVPLKNLKPTPLADMGENHRPSLYRFSRRDGFMVGSGSHHLFEKGEQRQIFFLSAFDDEAKEVFCFNQQPTGYNFRKPITVDEEADWIPYSRWALGNGGKIFCSPRRTEYFIEVRDIQGNLLREIKRESKPHKRSRDEKEDAKKGYSFGTSGMDMPEISYKISDHAQTINNLRWVDDQLWVHTSEAARKMKESNLHTVDIFDPAGQLIEERSYEIPMNPKEDQVHWLDGGRAVVVTNVRSARRAARDSGIQFQVGEGEEESFDDEEAVLEVILYQARN